MENIISYTGLFIALLFISGLIINGIYIVTRGETITAPDGTEKDQNDMILYPLLKWITQKKGEYFIQYKGDQLDKLINQINKRFPQAPIPKIMISDDLFILGMGNVSAENLMETWIYWTREFLEEKDIVLSYQPADGDRIVFRLAEKYPIYKFSVYLRKPVLQCIKCMASVWGTIIFWPTVLYIFGFTLIEVPIWIAFCFALTWVNTYLYNKIS